jgi:hypothetical protein
MQVRQRRLEPVDPENWVQAVLDLSLKEGESEIEYVGEALVSSCAYGHLIEFKASTSMLSSATLDIPLLVSSNAIASISVNGHFVSTARLSSSGDTSPVLHHVRLDVTPWTEDRAVSSIRIRLSYERQEGTTTILMDRDGHRYAAGITEHFGWKSAVAIAFTGLAWTSILAVAILVVANVRAFGDSARFYAVLTIVGSWIVSVLGLPDLARVPLRSYLRNWYARTRGRRMLAVVAMACLMIVTCAQAARVVHCLVVRYRYTQLIATGLSESPDRAMDAARRAFILVPWRREAQILIDAYGYRLRTDASMDALRDFVSGFVNDDGVKPAIESALRKNGLPLALEGAPPQRWLSDPVVWYASLLPEAEEGIDNDLLQKAIEELNYRNPPGSFPQAYLLRTSLGLQLHIEDKDKRRQLRKDLITFLSADKDARLTTSHEYQVASDMIAVSFLHDCMQEDANDWFARELKARQRTSYDGYPLWNRPPQKLVLYHMFVSYSNIDESGIDLGRRTLDASDGCHSYRDNFQQGLLRQNLTMKDPDAWMKNTTLNTNLESLVNSTLQMGWRY